MLFRSFICACIIFAPMSVDANCGYKSRSQVRQENRSNRQSNRQNKRAYRKASRQSSAGYGSAGQTANYSEVVYTSGSAGTTANMMTYSGSAGSTANTMTSSSAGSSANYQYQTQVTGWRTVKKCSGGSCWYEKVPVTRTYKVPVQVPVQIEAPIEQKIEKVGLSEVEVLKQKIKELEARLEKYENRTKRTARKLDTPDFLKPQVVLASL